MESIGKIFEESIAQKNNCEEILVGNNITQLDILNEANSKIRIFEESPEYDLLKKIIAAVKPVNFRQLAGCTEGEKLKICHYAVITLEQLLLIAKSLGTPIAEITGKFYIYDKTYWRLIENADFKQFLGEGAEKLGISEFAARYFDFRDQLLKQAASTLHKTKEEKTSTDIKLNLSNGTLHVSESRVQLLPHNPDNLITYKLKFSYNPKSTCAKFNKFLNEVLPDENLQNILAEFLGYAFVPNNVLKLEKVLMLYGGGANGKSVFKEISCELFGRENVSENTLEQLTTPNGYFVAELENKLINYSPEISGKIESAGIFKTLTSGEPISVRRIYKDPTTIYNYARLAFNVNELPHNVQQTNAFFRRFLIVPFEITIAPEQQDKNLTQKIIKDELPGILNWVLTGLKRLLDQKGFTESNIVKEQLEEYRRDADSVLAFLNEYRYEKSIDKRKSLKMLFSEYLIFCSASGMPHCKDRTFSKRLKAADFKIERASFGMDVYLQQKENEKLND